MGESQETLLQSREPGRAVSTGKTPVKTLYVRVHYGGINVHPASWISLFWQVPHLPQFLLSAMLPVCQDYPCCNGESVSTLLRARQYVIFEVVVHDVWELQSITSSTPPPVVPAFEVPHYAFHFAAPNVPHDRYAGFHYVDDDLNNILRIRSQLAVDQLFP